jgi:hypothetical protein
VNVGRAAFSDESGIAKLARRRDAVVGGSDDSDCGLVDLLP